MALENFINEYFVSPIVNHTGYNPVNTLTYALIAVALLFFVIYPYLDKKKVKFNERFAFSVLPYVIFGATIRIFEEAYSSVFIVQRSPNPLEIGFYFISPGIYIMVSAITLIALAVSFKISSVYKKDALNIFRNIGIVLCAPVLAWHFLHFTHAEAFAGIAALALSATGVVIIATKRFKKGLFEGNLNKMALGGQVLDGSATSIILQFYPLYNEQHFVSSAIIQAFGPFAFLVTKIIVIIVILYFIDRMEEKKEITPNFAGFIKILIIILGFATGTRNVFSVSMTTAL